MAGAHALYASLHGSTAKVARLACSALQVPCPLTDVTTLATLDAVANADPLIIFCPTYGDEEMAVPLEDKLVACTHFPRRFVVCETGNYYGYDRYAFGALEAVAGYMTAGGAHPFASHVSIDTLPRIDKDTLGRWCAHLNGLFAADRLRWAVPT